jgi:hypothetical protein
MWIAISLRLELRLWWHASKYVLIELLDEKIPARRTGIGGVVFSSRLSWGNAGAAGFLDAW